MTNNDPLVHIFVNVEILLHQSLAVLAQIGRNLRLSVDFIKLFRMSCSVHVKFLQLLHLLVLFTEAAGLGHNVGHDWVVLGNESLVVDFLPLVGLEVLLARVVLDSWKAKLLQVQPLNEIKHASYKHRVTNY